MGRCRLQVIFKHDGQPGCPPHVKGPSALCLVASLSPPAVRGAQDVRWRRTARCGVCVVALTVDPGPVRGARAAGAAARVLARLELLAAAGLYAVVVEPFTRERATYTADAFVGENVVLLGMSGTMPADGQEERREPAARTRPASTGARAPTTPRAGARASSAGAPAREHRRALRPATRGQGCRAGLP